MWLVIDDVRDLPADAIARNYDAGLFLLEAGKGKWQHLCIDHDLGDPEIARNGHRLITIALEAGWVPSHVQIVSSNPVGVKNIAEALKAHGYESKDGRNFYK